jgi:hypothetical protein
MKAFRRVFVQCEEAGDAAVLDLGAGDGFGVDRHLVDAGDLHDGRGDDGGRSHLDLSIGRIDDRRRLRGDGALGVDPGAIGGSLETICVRGRGGAGGRR